MRPCLVVAIVGALFGACAVVNADQAAEEAAIRKAAEKIQAVFNEHDAKGLEPLFDEKIESWNGDAKGPSEHSKMYAEIFQRQPELQMNRLEEIGIIFVTPDVAIYKHRRKMTGRRDADGKSLSDLVELHTRVFVKRNGKWLLASYYSGIETEE
jgi:ketosteroid isomerase-like protein